MKKNATIFTPGTIAGSLVYVVLMALVLSCSGCGTQAESTSSKDDRPTFTLESPAPYPVLNAISNNPTVGDEREFLSIMERAEDGGESRTGLVRSITLQPDQTYSVLMHVHNGADADLGRDGIATGINFTLSAPTTVSRSTSSSLSVLLTAGNTDPVIISDNIELLADSDLRIKFTNADGEVYPIQLYDYGLEFQGYLPATVASADHKTVLSGPVGELLPGNSNLSGVWVYFYFETVEASDAAGL